MVRFHKGADKGAGTRTRHWAPGPHRSSEADGRQSTFPAWTSASGWWPEPASPYSIGPLLTVSVDIGREGPGNNRAARTEDSRSDLPKSLSRPGRRYCPQPRPRLPHFEV